MIKKFFLLILVSTVFLTSALPISAHTLKSDGSVGAVIHISPDDDPIIGEPANFFFEFKDTEGSFTPEKCSCLVTISKNDQEVFSQLLDTDNKQPSLSSASFSFTFSEKGVYQVKVVGNSIDAGSFPPFTLTYDLRVERESREQTGSSFIQDNLHFIILGLILLIFLALIFSKNLKKRLPDNHISTKILLLLFVLISTLFLHSLQLSRVVFAHQQTIHSEDTHPCCLPQTVVLANYVSIVQSLTESNETLTLPNETHSILSLPLSQTRSPPKYF